VQRQVDCDRCEQDIFKNRCSLDIWHFDESSSVTKFTGVTAGRYDGFLSNILSIGIERAQNSRNENTEHRDVSR
jgi:hypothetical protein